MSDIKICSIIRPSKQYKHLIILIISHLSGVNLILEYNESIRPNISAYD